MEFKVKDGQIIYYRDLGKGFPIVFLHGNNLSGNYFGKQGILYRDYRLIFIDSRNHGRSSRQSVKMTFEQMAADLEEILQYLNIKKHLTKDGRLILAIENKFGLKYWAGCREDHIATFFGGIEGYAKDSYVRTFSKNELAHMLEQAGFSEHTFYYPYPDYKLPEKIFSDEYLPHENELNVNHRNFDRNRVRLFDENKVYGELIRAEMFPEFSNSFLIVAKGV